MTIEYEKSRFATFLEEVRAINEGRLRQGAESGLRTEIKKRNEAYAAATEKLIEGVPYANLLNLSAIAEKRAEVLCHIADVVYRKHLGLGNELNLTLSDVVVLAVAAQLRVQDEASKKTRTPLLHFIPDKSHGGLSQEEKRALTARVVEYQMNDPAEVYKNDNPDKLARVLSANFISEISLKQLAMELNLKSSDPITRRIDHFKDVDADRLAILISGSRIESTFMDPKTTYQTRIQTVWREKRPTGSSLV